MLKVFFSIIEIRDIEIHFKKIYFQYYDVVDHWDNENI